MRYSTKAGLTPQIPECHRLWQRVDSFAASLLFVMLAHVSAATLSRAERERERGGVWGGFGGGYQRLIKNDAICLRLRRLPFPPSTPSIKGAASPARPVINLPLYYRSDLSLNSALPPPPPPSCGGSSLSPCHAAVSRRPPSSSFPRVEQQSFLAHLTCVIPLPHQPRPRLGPSLAPLPMRDSWRVERSREKVRKGQKADEAAASPPRLSPGGDGAAGWRFEAAAFLIYRLRVKYTSWPGKQPR